MLSSRTLLTHTSNFHTPMRPISRSFNERNVVYMFLQSPVIEFLQMSSDISLVMTFPICATDPPILLSGNEVVPRIQTGAAGQAWFSLDKNCALHYHLMFSGVDRGRRNLMTAELQGFADYGEVPQPYEEHVHFLRSFEGQTVCMHVPDVSTIV